MEAELYEGLKELDRRQIEYREQLKDPDSQASIESREFDKAAREYAEWLASRKD